MAPLVAFVSGSYRPDRCGVADYTKRLALSLETEGVTTCVVTSEQSQIDTQLPPFPVAITLTRDWRLSGLAGLARRLSKLKPHVVHVQHSASSFDHSHGFGLFPLLLKVFMPGVPIVTTVHEYGGWRIKMPVVLAPVLDTVGSWFERAGIADREDLFLLSLSRAVVVTNQYHFDYIGATVPGVANKLRLVPIGPNVLVPSASSGQAPSASSGQALRARGSARAAALNRLGLPPSASLVCYFGFIHPVKGLESLLRAFHRLSSRLERAHLVVIGGVQSMSLTQDEAEGYYRKLLGLKAELGLNGKVIFTGYLPDDRVSELLQAADACVLPFNHGISLKSGSLLAAMAHGLPVLATRTEATSADLRDGENILLVPPRDADALASAMERLLSSPSLRAALAEGALTLAARFSWKQIADAHAHLYNTLVMSNE